MFKSWKRHLLVLIVFVVGMSAARAADVKPFENVEGWGVVVDAAGDCSFSHENGRFKITVPGSYHDLWPLRGKVNAPLVLQDATGNFTVEVKIAHIDQADRGTAISGLTSSVAFHAGTLVIWQDAKNFIRFDRTDMNNAGRAITSCYFHAFTDGARVVEQSVLVPNKPTHLRLARKGSQFTASYSHDDGKTWHTVRTARLDLPDKVKVGVSALNNTTQTCTVVFEELKVAQE